MIKGGELTPDCNFEVEWTNYKENSIKNEEDLFKILKEFLWHRCDRDIETYLMLSLNISGQEGEQFKEIYKEDKGPLIPNPAKEPFQLIHEHTLGDAFYEFNYIDQKSPLNIEYQTYDNAKFLLNISQKGEDCEFNFQGDGGTVDQFVTFRFLNEKGEMHSVRSLSFGSSLPLEVTEDNEEEYIQDIKNVARKFFNILQSKKKAVVNRKIKLWQKCILNMRVINLVSSGNFLSLVRRSQSVRTAWNRRTGFRKGFGYSYRNKRACRKTSCGKN